LNDFKDKEYLQPIRISSTDEQRVIELLKSSKTNSIDLSCPSCLEQKYGIAYRKLFAILANIHDKDGFFVDNPINRYNIGDRTSGLKNNTDGSLDIYISSKNPRSAKS
jgi:hypothetical protein